MATAERPVATAEDRAWDLFFESLDSGSEAAERVPPGAAIIAADSPDREALVRRYHADRRSVVLVHPDGRSEVRRPHTRERTMLLVGLAVLAGLFWRSGQRTPA